MGWGYRPKRARNFLLHLGDVVFMKTNRYTYSLCLAIWIAASSLSSAVNRNVPTDKVGQNSLPIGAKGVAWYTTWDTALEEAQRSQRPIFFMTGASQCGEVSGMFCPGYTKSDNQLFTQPSFIELSERFVCVRLASLESPETVARIRSLQGKFGNTVFVIFAPDGETMLTKVGKSPRMVFGNRKPYRELERIADRYSPRDPEGLPVLQDFDSLKQALLTSSADQRLLIYSVGLDATSGANTEPLREIASDPELRGRFHFDQSGAIDRDWTDAVSGADEEAGHFVIRPGKFGLEGTVMAHLESEVQTEDFKDVLRRANADFAASEQRKVFKEHLNAGQAAGVEFENHWIKNVHDKRAVRRGDQPAGS